MEPSLQVIDVPDRMLGKRGISAFQRALEHLERRLATGECRTATSEVRFIPHTPESRRAWEERVRQHGANPEKRDRLYIRPWAKPAAPRPPVISTPPAMHQPRPKRSATPAPALETQPKLTPKPVTAPAPRPLANPAPHVSAGPDPVASALQAIARITAEVEGLRVGLEQIRQRGPVEIRPRARKITRMDCAWLAMRAVAASKPEFQNADVHAELARRGEARCGSDTAFHMYCLHAQGEIVRVGKVGRHWIWRLNPEKP